MGLFDKFRKVKDTAKDKSKDAVQGKKPKCSFCGTRIEGKPIFDHGMFFCKRKCKNDAEKAAKEAGKSKPDKEVCSFC